MWSNGFEIFCPRILSMLSETTLTVQVRSLRKIYLVLLVHISKDETLQDIKYSKYVLTDGLDSILALLYLTANLILLNYISVSSNYQELYQFLFFVMLEQSNFKV
jgi:hypothetical protein